MNLLTNAPKIGRIHTIKHMKMMNKDHVYMFSNIASYNTTAENRAKPFPSPFLISTSRFLILERQFQNDHVAACGTSLRSDNEKKEMGGFVTVPCSSKNTQRSNTADWPNF